MPGVEPASVAVLDRVRVEEAGPPLDCSLDDADVAGFDDSAELDALMFGDEVDVDVVGLVFLLK